jgi:serine/threonine-protein kinase ATR
MPAPNGSFLTELDHLRLPRGLLGRSLALGTFSQAFTLAFMLLDSFSPGATIGTLEKRRDLILRQNLPWVLNGYNRLRKVLVRWLQSAGLKLTPEEEEACLQFLASTRRLCVSRSSAPALPSDMSLTSTWAQCLSELIYPSIGNSFPSMQVEISNYLDEFVQSTRQSKSSAQLLREIFLPVLTEIEDGNLDLQLVDSRLWVTVASSSVASK